MLFRSNKPSPQQELHDQITLWGVGANEAELRIDIGYAFELFKPIIIDVETDEKDNFVGIAYTQDGKIVQIGRASCRERV